MPLILSDICYSYAPGTGYCVRALEGVDLSVSRGELVLVLGATGSGKSTLLRIASGLLAAASGSAEIDGEPLTAASARGAVGLVFQDAESQLFAETVAADVAFGPLNLGAQQEQAEIAARDALTAVGLSPEEFGARSPFTLSGGEARRVALAGVLAMRPPYLLVDEPTAGLDAPGRRALHAALMSARRDAGVVVVSHSAEEFLPEADRVVLLRDGSVSWSGSGDELVSHPEQFAQGGLRAPDVLEVQRLVRERGMDVGPYTLDAVFAARSLCREGVS